MKRIVMMLTVALVMAAMMVASVMPAFAQGKGPEGGNPGVGTCRIQQEETAGESEQRPLPFGGQEPKPAFENAPKGAVFASPGSPFSASNPAECPEPEA
jgi:hypothetical protein